MESSGQLYSGSYSYFFPGYTEVWYRYLQPNTSVFEQVEVCLVNGTEENDKREGYLFPHIMPLTCFKSSVPVRYDIVMCALVWFLCAISPPSIHKQRRSVSSKSYYHSRSKLWLDLSLMLMMGGIYVSNVYLCKLPFLLHFIIRIPYLDDQARIIYSSMSVFQRFRSRQFTDELAILNCAWSLETCQAQRTESVSFLKIPLSEQILPLIICSSFTLGLNVQIDFGIAI